MMKRAIVTGATGAVGTALVQELINHGIEVLVFCRPGSKRNVHIPQSPLVTCMECPLDRLDTVQNTTGKTYDTFYHFAWTGTTGAGRNDMYLQNANVKYTLDAVAAAHRFGCTAFVGAGSQAEYGRASGVLKPDTPTHPETGYGIAKLCAGQMARERAHQLGLRAIWVRILSVFGPNDGSQSMVMSTIQKLQSGQSPEFTKGEQIWDYVYSRDAAAAFRLLGQSNLDGKTYVLGSGRPRPLKSYICAIRDIVAPNAELRMGAIPYADRQVMHLEADISALNRDVGFEPAWRFEDGIRAMIMAQNDEMR